MNRRKNPGISLIFNLEIFGDSEETKAKGYISISWWKHLWRRMGPARQLAEYIWVQESYPRKTIQLYHSSQMKFSDSSSTNPMESKLNINIRWRSDPENPSLERVFICNLTALRASRLHQPWTYLWVSGLWSRYPITFEVGAPAVTLKMVNKVTTSLLYSLLFINALVFVILNIWTQHNRRSLH